MSKSFQFDILYPRWLDLRSTDPRLQRLLPTAEDRMKGDCVFARFFNWPKTRMKGSQRYFRCHVPHQRVNYCLFALSPLKIWVMNLLVGPEMGFLWCVCDVSRTGRDRFSGSRTRGERERAILWVRASLSNEKRINFVEIIATCEQAQKIQIRYVWTRISDTLEQDLIAFNLKNNKKISAGKCDGFRICCK